MKLVKGRRYGKWVYVELYEDEYASFNCDLCGQLRKKLHWFHEVSNPDDVLKVGSNCIDTAFESEVWGLKGTVKGRYEEVKL